MLCDFDHIQNGHGLLLGCAYKTRRWPPLLGTPRRGILSGWGPAQEQRFFERPFVHRPGIWQGSYLGPIWRP